MISRREFLKYTTAGGALASVGYSQTAVAGIRQIMPDERFCFEGERVLPVYKEVDVVVIGGSARAVEAATAAARVGASVFLVCQLPYLGEDICGTLVQYEGLNRTPRNISGQYFYGVEGSLKTALSVKLFKNQSEPPTPLAMKSVLENALIDHGVDFLYSSFFTNLLVDEHNAAAGVVIANRSGRQAIKAKEVIDATQTAEAAKAVGAKQITDSTGNSTFHFRVVGNAPAKEVDGLSAQLLPHQVKVNGKEYPVTRYTLSAEWDGSSYDALMEIEQRFRDLTFDPDQVDSADLLDFIPPYVIEAQESYSGEYRGVRKLPFAVFSPRSQEGLTLLNHCCHTSRTVREALSVTDLLLMGEIIGTKVALRCKDRPLAKKIRVRTTPQRTDDFGKVNEVLLPLRMNNSKEKIVSPKGALPVLGRYDVVVLGGGTAGASAAISSSKFGAKTAVIEYLHGLGGLGTLGKIGIYWDGYRDGFTAEIDRSVKEMAPADHPRQKPNWNKEWPSDWKSEWYRQQIRKNGGHIWFGVMGCGAVVKANKVTGVVVATPFGRGVLLCDLLIDSTGSADIAIAAGAKYNFVDKRSLAVQGAGLPQVDPGDHYNNTDWTFIDDSDILDVTRLFIQGKQKFAGHYDLGKLPQTRERRRVVGEYEVTTYDVINHRTYADTISYHKSSFDTHGITINPLFTLSPPQRQHVIYEADLPLRSLLPKGLDGILVTGLGTCVDRDAMPVVRMQPCLQNQGYSVGYLAATCIKEKKAIRQIDIRKIQHYLVEIGNLPARVLTETDFKGFSDKELAEAVETMKDNFKGVEKLMFTPEKSLKLVNRKLPQTTDPAAQLIYASFASILGDGAHAPLVAKQIENTATWDNGWHYTGMGQFGECMSRLDAYIMALGNSKQKNLLHTLIAKAESLDPESEYSHIRAVSEAFEAMGDNRAADVLHALLCVEGVEGWQLDHYRAARDKTIPGDTDVFARNKALKEITLARALYFCGDKEGLGRTILEKYANGLERIYVRYAEESL